jgi:hypothetical protein
MGERVIFHRQTLLFIGVLAMLAALTAFVFWATRTEQRVFTYYGRPTVEVNQYLSSGWKIVQTDSQPLSQGGFASSRQLDSYRSSRSTDNADVVAVTVTLERSNWDRLWH